MTHIENILKALTSWASRVNTVIEVTKIERDSIEAWKSLVYVNPASIELIDDANQEEWSTDFREIKSQINFASGITIYCAETKLQLAKKFGWVVKQSKKVKKK